MQREGFCLVHTPILTANDCEGAGEVFAVEVTSSDATCLIFSFFLRSPHLV